MGYFLPPENVLNGRVGGDLGMPELRPPEIALGGLCGFGGDHYFGVVDACSHGLLIEEEYNGTIRFLFRLTVGPTYHR